MCMYLVDFVFNSGVCCGLDFISFFFFNVKVAIFNCLVGDFLDN